MLDSQDVELRVVSGETIALFYELGREEDEVRSRIMSNLHRKTACLMG